jgi:hypothetical protein
MAEIKPDKELLRWCLSLSFSFSFSFSLSFSLSMSLVTVPRGEMTTGGCMRGGVMLGEDGTRVMLGLVPGDGVGELLGDMRVGIGI